MDGAAAGVTERPTTGDTGSGGAYTSGAKKMAVAAPKHNIRLQHFTPYGYYPPGFDLTSPGRSVEDARMVGKFEPKFAATLKRDLETDEGLVSEQLHRHR